jgi:hypothetical protein
LERKIFAGLDQRRSPPQRRAQLQQKKKAFETISLDQKRYRSENSKHYTILTYNEMRLQKAPPQRRAQLQHKKKKAFETISLDQKRYRSRKQ